MTAFPKNSTRRGQTAALVAGKTKTSTSTSTSPTKTTRTNKHTTSSRSQKQQQVSWSFLEVTVHTIDNLYELESSILESIWYSRQELREMRTANQSTPSSSSSSNDSTPDQSRDWIRYQHHRDCINKVLDEQDRQRGIDKTEFQGTAYPIVKRVNNMHIPFDHDRLAALCRDATAHARRVAWLQGRKDYEAIQDDHAKFQKEQAAWLQQQQKQTLQQQPPLSSCDTTIASEFLSDSGNTEQALVEEEWPSIPTTITTTTMTKEEMEQHYQQRYSAYLVNRQERIAAREKAEHEWEQRRLQRKADIWSEANTSIRRLERIIDMSVQMSLLATGASSA